MELGSHASHLEASDLGRLEDNLQAIARIRDAVDAGGASDEVLELMATSARSLVESSVAMVFLVGKSGGVVLRTISGEDSPKAMARRLADHAALVRSVALTGRTHVIPPLARPRPTPGESSDSDDDFGATMLVPFAVRSRVLGVLELLRSDRDRVFTDDEIAQVKVFAAQVGLALEAHLRVGVVLLDALSLERRRRQTAARLESLGTAPMNTREAPRQVMDTLARTAVELTNLDACAFQLFEPDLGVRTVGSFGLSDALVGAMDHAAGAGAASPALETVARAVPVVMLNERDRIRTDPRFDGARELAGAVTWAAETCLPLAIPHGCAGALCCFFAPDRPPTDTDLRLLRTIAAEAASVLDNAPQLAAENRRVALDERLNLARDLHDTVSQTLYGIALGARTALEYLGQEPALAREPMDYVLQLAEKGLAEIRALIFDLRPDELEREGLAAVLAKQAAALSARRGVAVEAVVAPLPPITTDVQLAVYRIAEEALNNATRHARARKVEVRCRMRGQTLVLDVVDDGTGFDAKGEFPGHFGLRSMQERAAALGGSVRVRSRPGRGTQVHLTVPVSGEGLTGDPPG